MLAIFAPLAIGQTAQCFPKPKSPAPAGYYCNSPRAVINSPVASKAILLSNLGFDPSYCAGFCVYSKDCKSFTFDSANGNCTTYNARGTTMGLGPKNPAATIRFNSVNCFATNTTVGPVFFSYVDQKGTTLVVIDPPSSTDGRAIFVGADKITSGNSGHEFEKNCDGFIQQYSSSTTQPSNGNVAYATNDHKVVFVPVASSASAYKPIYISFIGGNSTNSPTLAAQSAAGKSFWNCKNFLYISDTVPVANGGCVKTTLSVQQLA